jgi:hypothetical protein
MIELREILIIFIIDNHEQKVFIYAEFMFQIVCINLFTFRPEEGTISSET